MLVVVGERGKREVAALLARRGERDAAFQWKLLVQFCRLFAGEERAEGTTRERDEVKFGRERAEQQERQHSATADQPTRTPFVPFGFLFLLPPAPCPLSRAPSIILHTLLCVPYIPPQPLQPL